MSEIKIATADDWNEPATEVLELPSGKGGVILYKSLPQNLWTLVARGEISSDALEAMTGGFESFDQVAHLVPKVVCMITKEPKIHNDTDGSKTPKGSVAFSALSDDDATAIFNHAWGLSQEEVADAETFHDEPGGEADQESGEGMEQTS